MKINFADWLILLQSLINGTERQARPGPAQAKLVQSEWLHAHGAIYLSNDNRATVQEPIHLNTCISARDRYKLAKKATTWRTYFWKIVKAQVLANQASRYFKRWKIITCIPPMFYADLAW